MRIITVVLFFLALLDVNAAQRINGAGASFPAPLYYDWAFSYQKSTKNRVNYQSIGSGGGVKQVVGRIVDFGATDHPLQANELEQHKLLQFPSAIGSIVVVFHLEGVKDGTLRLKNSVVAEIFAGTITRWNDPKIAHDNPDIELPDQKIVTVHRSDGSGTTFNFSYFLNGSANFWRERFGVGKTIDWPGGIGGKGNEGVANLVKQTPYTIGYVEHAYKETNGLSAALLQSASGEWVAAEEESVRSAADGAIWRSEEHFYALLALQKGANVYPIVAATFILLPAERTEKNRQVVEFFDHAFKNGDERTRALGYIPLPQRTKEMVRAYWKEHIKGLKE